MRILRIIDANINRASEGIRVIEDIFRFFYNNKNISEKLKKIRHDIRVKTKKFNLIDYRDSINDLGKETFLKEEVLRDDIEDVIKANIKRVEESFRVLEEIFKILDLELSEFFKKVRFEIYTLEKKIFSKKNKFFSLFPNKPILYGIIDKRFSSYSHYDIAKQLLDGGIKIIQLREKILTDKEFVENAIKIKKLTENYDALFIVNDRIDIAVICDADGVHLGQGDIDVKIARNFLGENKIIGLSTHNFAQVKDAIEIKPDYIGFGPIFPTKSKENPDPVVGVDNLRKILKEVRSIFPVVAIGGINLNNIKDVISCKPHMICVMSGIIGQKDIVRTVKKYMEIIDDST